MHLDQIYHLPHSAIYSFGSDAFQVLPKKAPELTQKVQSIIIPLFKPLSLLFLSIKALNEICIKARLSKKEESLAIEVQKERIFSSSEYFEEHGSLLLAASACGVLEEVGKQRQCTPQLILAAGRGGSLLFLYANIVELIENIRVYDLLTIAMEQNSWDYYGALSGIVSNLSYIVAIGTTLFSPWTTLAIIMSILGMTAGGFKVMCELMQFDKHHTMIGLSTMALSKN